MVKVQKFSEFVYLQDLLKKIGSESLGIKRKDMPQILSSDFDDLKEWLSKSGLPYHNLDAIPSHLKATQCEFNAEKIRNFDLSRGGSPIIISNDGYLIDGHHRWIAAMISNVTLRAIQIDLPVIEALNALHKYDNVAYKKVNESNNENL